MLGWLRGEMAMLEVDRDVTRYEEMNVDEFIEDELDVVTWPALIREAKRRKLNV